MTMTTTNKPKNTDQDLLELSAKAAGIKLAGPVNSHIPSGGVWIVTEQSNRDRVWDPLNNDGDALRLAVKLGITISFWGHLEEVATYTPDYGTPAAQEIYSQGKAVATRRAIVRTAAEMGRDKP